MADLKTNYVDDVLETTKNKLRKYQQIQNDDGTVSFVDVTEYAQVGTSFGAKDINDTNAAINDVNRKLGNYLTTVQFKLANTGIIESNGIKSYESIDVSEAIPSGYSLAFALGGYTGDNQFHFFGLFANPIKNTITAYIGNSSNTADSGDPIVILVCLKN